MIMILAWKVTVMLMNASWFVALAFCRLVAKFPPTLAATPVCLIPPAPPTTSSNCSSLSSTYVNSFFITGFSFSLLTNVVLVPVHNQVTGNPHYEHSHHTSHLTWITVWHLRPSIIPSSYCVLDVKL